MTLYEVEEWFTDRGFEVSARFAEAVIYEDKKGSWRIRIVMGEAGVGVEIWTPGGREPVAATGPVDLAWLEKNVLL